MEIINVKFLKALTEELCRDTIQLVGTSDTSSPRIRQNQNPFKKFTIIIEHQQKTTTISTHAMYE